MSWRAVVVGLGLGLGACGGSETTPVAAGPPPAKSVQLNAPGASVDVAAALVPGYVVVVDFWSASCGACEVVGARLDTSVARADRVLIRKVDVADVDNAVSRAYQIGALPHFDVYDQHGRLRYSLVGNDALKAGDLAIRLARDP